MSKKIYRINIINESANRKDKILLEKSMADVARDELAAAKSALQLCADKVGKPDACSADQMNQLQRKVGDLTAGAPFLGKKMPDAPHAPLVDTSPQAKARRKAQMAQAMADIENMPPDEDEPAASKKTTKIRRKRGGRGSLCGRSSGKCIYISASAFEKRFPKSKFLKDIKSGKLCSKEMIDRTCKYQKNINARLKRMNKDVGVKNGTNLRLLKVDGKLGPKTFCTGIAIASSAKDSPLEAWELAGCPAVLSKMVINPKDTYVWCAAAEKAGGDCTWVGGTKQPTAEPEAAAAADDKESSQSAATLPATSRDSGGKSDPSMTEAKEGTNQLMVRAFYDEDFATDSDLARLQLWGKGLGRDWQLISTIRMGTCDTNCDMWAMIAGNCSGANCAAQAYERLNSLGLSSITLAADITDQYGTYSRRAGLFARTIQRRGIGTGATNHLKAWVTNSEVKSRLKRAGFDEMAATKLIIQAFIMHEDAEEIKGFGKDYIDGAASCSTLYTPTKEGGKIQYGSTMTIPQERLPR